MTETVVQEAVATTPVKTPKKKATTPKAKSAGTSKKNVATHPPTAQMVNNAIKSLKERGGSSLQAIKKYIAGTYKVDAEKLSPFIKKYLKSAVDGGKLIRTKGKGASGSFKLPAPEPKKAEKKPKVVKAKKPKAAPKVKKPKTEKSAASPKKSKATKPKAPKVKSEKPKVAVPKKKAPSKVKKTTKAPAAKKPKSPKLKKAAPKPKTVKVAAKK